MEVDKSLIAKLKSFQENLSKYHELANRVWAIENGKEYVSAIEITRRRDAENKMRRRLNVDYGSLSSAIDALNGRRPMMAMPGGARWEIFPEALSGRFSLIKGESLIAAQQTIDNVVGVAQNRYEESRKRPKKAAEGKVLFDDDLLARVNNRKIKQLCKEVNNCWPQSPNASALLIRTILLIALQQMLGGKAKEDLGPVLQQAIAQDVYKDRQVTKILSNFAAMPKVLLDATHHSQWMLLKDEDVRHLLMGLVKVIEATYPEVVKNEIS